MSTRFVLAIAYVVFFVFYTWRKDWFIGLCSCIILMAFVEHPDMPKSIGGIQGFNLWNILFANVFLAWWSRRRYENLELGLPGVVRFLFISYMIVILISSLRLLLFTKDSAQYTTMYVISEFFINTFKWVFPGILLYDGCRTRKRVTLAIVSILSVYLLLAIQIIKEMPLGYLTASGDVLADRAARRLVREIGYYRTNLSMMLSGACWAVLMLLLVTRKNLHKILIIGAACIISLGQALTGGRTGYVTWGLIGFILGALKWRRILLAIPIVVILIVSFVPSVTERMLQGISGNDEIDTYSMTSGRTLIWPYVIDKIKERPITGYGRQAMKSTGIADFLLETLSESFPHPHNAYLEIMFDSGIIGLILILAFYLTMLFYSFSLLIENGNSFHNLIGGISASLILSLLIASFGGQSFYPRESYVGMLASMGIMLRVYVERSRSYIYGKSIFDPEINE